MRLLTSMYDSLVGFWFNPQSTVLISLFRICIGLLVLQVCYLLAGDLFVWFGDSSLVPRHWTGRDYVDLLRILPAGNTGIQILFGLLVLSAFTMTVGLCTRLSTIVTWLCLLSIHNANPFIFNGGDGLLRISTFFLMFSPCGASLSVDRWFAIRGSTASLIDPLRRCPWVQRLIQLQIACIYWQAFWGKTVGAHWIDGTAVYYVVHLTELQRIQIPLLFENIWISKFLTWGTLVYELAFWLLIWFKPLRNLLLLGGIALHLGIDVMINLPIFGWAMISSYLLFLDDEDVRYCLAKFNSFRLADNSRLTMSATAGNDMVVAVSVRDATAE